MFLSFLERHIHGVAKNLCSTLDLWWSSTNADLEVPIEFVLVMKVKFHLIVDNNQKGSVNN